MTLSLIMPSGNNFKQSILHPSMSKVTRTVIIDYNIYRVYVYGYRKQKGLLIYIDSDIDRFYIHRFRSRFKLIKSFVSGIYKHKLYKYWNL